MVVADDETRGTGEEREGGAGGAGIKLDQFLKWAGITPTGGQAKILIQDGAVRVNGVVETRRGRRLHAGDRVEVAGRTLVVDVA